MASNKWLEPTIGWVSAKPDPVNNNKVNNAAKLAEAILAYKFLHGNDPRATLSTPKQYTDWYASIQSNPPPAYKAYITRTATQVKRNQLQRSQEEALAQWRSGKISKAQYAAQVNKAATEIQQLARNPKAFDNLSVSQIISQGLTPWQNSTFNAPNTGGSQTIAQAVANSGSSFNFSGITPPRALEQNWSRSGGNVDRFMGLNSMGGMAGNPLAPLAQPTSGLAFAIQQSLNAGQAAKTNDVYVGQNLAPGVTRTIAELVADRTQNKRKSSSNDYYNLNQDVLAALGINDTLVNRGKNKSPLVSKTGIAHLNNSAFYDPSAYDDPTLMRFFDAISANKRGSGSYTYSDEANVWGGKDYADEAAIAIFKKYGMTPEQLTAKYGQFNGLTNSDLNPLVYNVQTADGRTAYYVPYDFAIHGVVGNNKTNFMPAKPLDWWLNNATPISLGSSFKMPDANKNNPYSLRSATPNIGFITTMNPLADNPNDRAAFMRDLGLGATDGESNQFTNGLYAGTSRIRQSYDDGGSFLQKAIGAIASMGLNFVPGFQALGPVFGSVLSSAIGGSIAGSDPASIAKGAAFSGLGAAAGEWAGRNLFNGYDYLNAPGILDPKSMSTFGSFGTKVIKNATPHILESVTSRNPEAPQTSTFAPTSAATAQTGGTSPTPQGGAPSPTNPAQSAAPDAATSVAQAPAAQQATFKTSVAADLDDVHPTPNGVTDPSIFARDRRWGGRWGQTIRF